ncbi:MAG: hypothetical protein KKC51_09215 [Verrucomicrobia bacterium]|nr:hypothetical protein [Verrucomicrobiota bacterium]
MKRPLSTSREGSLTPLVLAMLTIIVIVGLFIIDMLQVSVLEKRAAAVAKAVALEALYLMQTPEYTPPPGRDTDTRRQRLDAVARANGFDARIFQPLASGDMAVGPTWVRVKIQARNHRVPSQEAIAYGLPAGRIAAGASHRDAKGAMTTTGCLPLGLSRAAAWQQTLDVNLRGENAQGRCLRLQATEDPADHVRFLGSHSGRDVEGVPPPAVEVGQALQVQEADAKFLTEMKARLEGRIVVVPVLHENTVAGFGRMRIVAVNVDQAVVTLAPAPSAVSYAASTGPAGGPQEENSPRSVSPFGLVLVAHLKGRV